MTDVEPHAPSADPDAVPGPGAHLPPGADAGIGFDARFDELARTAHRVAFRMLGDREEARDIAQEALARAYARWPKVEANASAWVSRVATNLALDHIRRRRPTERATPTGTDVAQVAALRADLVHALQRLPRRQRDVVVLRYLADVSEADVAALLGCRVGTVKQHASRGLAALRTTLGSDPASAPPPTPGDPEPISAPAPTPVPNELGATAPGPVPSIERLR